MQRNRSDLNRRQFFARSAMAAGATALGAACSTGWPLDRRLRARGERGAIRRPATDPSKRPGRISRCPTDFSIGSSPMKGTRWTMASPRRRRWTAWRRSRCPTAMCCWCATMKTRRRATRCVRGRRAALLECRDSEQPPRDTLRPPRVAFDAYAGGGTVTLEVEPHGQRQLVRQHWSLVGTLRNCAGGPTPWGSWLLCEETLENSSATGYAQNHGYIFEVPIDTVPGIPAQPVALKHGRTRTRPSRWTRRREWFTRPRTRETAPASIGSCHRRSRPSPGDLAVTSPALLQMLKWSLVHRATRRPSTRRSASKAPGRKWVTHYESRSPHQSASSSPGQTLSAVFVEGLAAGGARFRRLEGCWDAAARILFISTNGGNMGFGQVWLCTIPGRERLTLVAQPPWNHDVFDGPDINASCTEPTWRAGVVRRATAAQFVRRHLPLRRRVSLCAEPSQGWSSPGPASVPTEDRCS